VFGKILLPMARPAIAAGIALALMETLNDIGAVEYLGVRTLTFSVYNTWLARGSLAGAAQIALIMMIVVFALLALENHARRQMKFSGGRASHILHPPVRRKLTGRAGAVAMLACTMPVIIGFGIPFWVLLGFALKRLDQLLDPAFRQALGNSILTGTLAAVITVLASLLLMHAGRTFRSHRTSILLRLASMGYAVPGTVLAIGLVFTLGAADRWFNFVLSQSGLPTAGLVFSGSLFAVVFAACIRFLAVADSGIHSGLSKLPPNIDHAARNLGRSPRQAMMQVMLPLLSPAVMTSLVLVFVDTVKELSATILLRPIGFNTLATLTYENASRAAVEDGAVAALAIVFVSLVPVLILSRSLASDRVA
jgi:iron(III) transport system permease protein